MKTLETIQKTCKVFYYLAKVGMILSFVWSGLSLSSAISCLIWHSIGVPEFINEILLEYNINLLNTGGELLGDFVFGVTDGILFFFAMKYLKQELVDGTPFTLEGSSQVKILGIKIIVMPIIAIIISSIIYACFDLSPSKNISNGTSVLLGICLILVSLILRHGAELREEGKNDKTQN